MKACLAIALLTAQTLLSVAQPAESRKAQPRLVPMATRPPNAWMGLKVAKPDETITAHVPSLPQGIGFVVKAVDAGGPAEAAGLTQFDLLWKLGDQMLVNEAQLAALLRLSKPGEEVTVSAFRGGKPLELKLKLGEAPQLQKPISGEMLEAAMLPGSCDLPMRVVNVAEKSASFSADEGEAVVRREGEAYHVKISGPNDEAIFEGELPKDGGLDKLPEQWRKKIQVLCRTLDQALESGMIPQRQPRPRVVVTDAIKP
jgi:hypothetical protein